MAYRGNVVELPLGNEGLTGSKNLSLVSPGYLTEALNCSFDRGMIQKEGGAAKYNSSAITGAPTILGGWDHYTNALAQRMVVACSDGKLYKDSGAGTFATTLKSGLTATMRPFFVEGGKEAAANNRKLFVFTGTDVVQVLADDGATTADIATPPADWTGSSQPSFGFIHNYRLLAGGNINDPHRIYYSTTSNQEDFTGAGSGSLAIYPGEGEALTGGISFGNYAVVFKKPLGVYIIDMRDATASNWTVQRLTRAVGLASPWAVVQTEADLIFMDATGGIQALSNSPANVDVEARNLGQHAEIEPVLRELLSLGDLDEVRAVYYVAKREVHFAFTSLGNSVNNYRLILDFYQPDHARFRLSNRDTCTALWLRRDTNGIRRIMTGDNAGFVWQLDQSTYTKAGSAYETVITTAPTDLGYADPKLGPLWKNAAFLELTFEPAATNSVNVAVYWDDEQAQSVTFEPQNRGVELGTFVLGTDQLGGKALASQRKRLVGGGRFVSLRFTNSVAGENFSIGRAHLYFTTPGKF